MRTKLSLKPLLVAALLGLASMPPALADDAREPRQGDIHMAGWTGGGDRGGDRGGQGGSWGSDRRGQGGGGGGGGGGNRSWGSNRGDGGGGGGGGGGGNRSWGGNRGNGGGARIDGGGNRNLPMGPSGRMHWDNNGAGWNRGDRGGAPPRRNDGVRLNDGGNGAGQQGRPWGGDRGGSVRSHDGDRGDWMRGNDGPGRTRAPSWQAPSVRPVEPASRGWVNPPMRRSPQGNWPSHARWWDKHHHHNHYYPRTGYYASGLSSHAYATFYLGSRYWYDDGIWYSPYNAGYVVVRPPYGVVVTTLPGYYTIVYGNGVTYYYANGVYYVPYASGGYQVVAPPPDVAASADSVAAGYEPPIIYPSQGQSAEQQSQDQYECHAWSVKQSGFDPTQAPAGQPGSDDAVLRGNYSRAFEVCMEGRGYAVN